jgi:ABC-type uncharacterized transport system substrate-binding protein
VALEVEVIVASGTPAARAAEEATRTIPIVFTAVAAPITSSLVTSLARPGGNVTGLAVLAPKLVGKELELLKHAIPAVSRVAVLWEPDVDKDVEQTMLKEADAAARKLGMRPQFVEARAPADLDRAFSDMTKARADGLAVLTSSMFFGQRQRLVDLTAKHRPCTHGGKVSTPGA